MKLKKRTRRVRVNYLARRKPPRLTRGDKRFLKIVKLFKFYQGYGVFHFWNAVFQLKIDPRTLGRYIKLMKRAGLLYQYDKETFEIHR